MAEEKSYVFGKKEYVIQDKDTPAWKVYREAFKECREYALLQDAKVAIMMVHPVISKRCVARVFRVHPHTKIYSGMDYIIEISADVWEKLDDEKRRILLYHECEHMHVVVDKKDKKHYRLVQHDLIDFRSVVGKYGVDWLTSIEKTNNDLHAVDGKPTPDIKIVL